MKITFTAEAAEIAEQEPGNLCVLGVLGGSFLSSGAPPAGPATTEP